MSLSFLSKKTWHTSNIKNVEQVWIAEQKKEKEEKKLKELQKQIEEKRIEKEAAVARTSSSEPPTAPSEYAIRHSTRHLRAAIDRPAGAT